VFREIVSGAKTDRAQLRRALDQLAAGDVLLVTRLDRLARSTRDLLNTLAAIADRGARGYRRAPAPSRSDDENGAFRRWNRRCSRSDLTQEIVMSTTTISPRGHDRAFGPAEIMNVFVMDR
jgi:hypothetical protein